MRPLILIAAPNQELISLHLKKIPHLASLQPGATRPLGYQLLKQEGLLLQSLPKDPVTPSGPNPCTYIPRGAPGTCKLKGMNIAGSVARSPPAFSKHAVDSSISKNIREQVQVS
ncbi:hypothetical protein D5086_013292 [Populus alba]|uniref:Uncharacterized protein n=1 Tax=Populus alba TaxID=43335 RepID=A0ACC4C521_POPAL